MGIVYLKSYLHSLTQTYQCVCQTRSFNHLSYVKHLKKKRCLRFPKHVLFWYTHRTNIPIPSIGPVGCKPTALYLLFSIPTCVFGPVRCKPTASYHFFQSPDLFWPCWLQTYSLISIAFNPHMCFWPCWLQTYSLISIVFNPLTCLGPAGCKPTASYQFFSIPTCVFGPVGCKPTASYHFVQSSHLFSLFVANLQPHIVFVRSLHLFRPWWLQTYSLMSYLFNPHTCFGPVGCKPTASYVFVQSSHLFWPCWLQTYSLISFLFNPRTCLGPVGCKPTASYRFCSILALFLALLVANLQPHMVFVQSSHLFRPCWLQTYSLMSYLFNPHACFGPVGCKHIFTYIYLYDLWMVDFYGKCR